MGMFSFMRADDCTNQKNFVMDDAIVALIPKEFGGSGRICGHYDGYGRIVEDNGAEHDVYEILAVMNKNYITNDIIDNRCWPNELLDVQEESPYTTKDCDRLVGINIGCHDMQQHLLKYPLKLVSAEYKGTYEDLDDYQCFSRQDPTQGFKRLFRY